MVQINWTLQAKDDLKSIAEFHINRSSLSERFDKERNSIKTIHN